MSLVKILLRSVFLMVATLSLSGCFLAHLAEVVTGANKGNGPSVDIQQAADEGDLGGEPDPDPLPEEKGDFDPPSGFSTLVDGLLHFAISFDQNIQGSSNQNVIANTPLSATAIDVGVNLEPDAPLRMAIFDSGSDQVIIRTLNSDDSIIDLDADINRGGNVSLGEFCEDSGATGFTSKSNVFIPFAGENDEGDAQFIEGTFENTQGSVTNSCFFREQSGQPLNGPIGCFSISGTVFEGEPPGEDEPSAEPIAVESFFFQYETFPGGCDVIGEGSLNR